MSPTNDRRTRFLSGTLAGAGAFLASYLLIYLYSGRDVEESFQPIEQLLAVFEAEPIGTWRAVGWVLYSAHFVDLRVVTSIGGFESVSYVDLVREGSYTPELLYLIPPLVLVVAGFLVARRVEPTLLSESAMTGATVAIGYAAAVLAGLYLFSYENTHPELVPAIVIAGFLYPVVFGAIGGAGASLELSRR